MPETEHDQHDVAAQGEARADGDLAGTGTGDSPDDNRLARPGNGGEAGTDPEVAELTENLRRDAEPFRVSPTDASEEAGTGTDR